MTNEQAIAEIKDYDNYPNGLSEECRDYIIKALGQQPSEDCVSRHAVKEGMMKYGFRAPDMTVTEFIEDELLTITSARKSGLCWIERFDNESMWLECPHCHMDSIAAYNYCPNCGASFKKEKRGSKCSQ